MASWPPPGAVWAMTTSELDQAETGLVQVLEEHSLPTAERAGVEKQLAKVIAQKRGRHAAELASRGRLH
jgi:hypothetical protein